MTKRRRKTGRERREERRRVREGPRWMRGNLLLIAGGAGTAGLVALALVLSVFGGDDDQALVLASPTPAPAGTATPVDKTGAPPVGAKPTRTHRGRCGCGAGGGGGGGQGGPWTRGLQRATPGEPPVPPVDSHPTQAHNRGR